MLTGLPPNPFGLNPRLLRRHSEPVALDCTGQSESFLHECLKEGLGDDEIYMLARSHKPTIERYDDRPEQIDRVVGRLLEQRHASGSAAASQPYLDWREAFAAASVPVSWVLPGILEVGESGSLTGAPKAGKSLLALDWAAARAAGRPILGEAVERSPVLYLDLENSARVVGERVQAMGYAPAELDLLHYQLGGIGPLDQPRNAAAVIAKAQEVDAQLVVIDTLQRVLSGDELSSQGIRDLYRLLLSPLKAMGVSILRLDHTGKDPSRGPRGTSAKLDDVDQAWSLSGARGEGLWLSRTHSRTGRGADNYGLVRRSGPLRHEISNEVAEPLRTDFDDAETRVDDLVEFLAEERVPESWGRPRIAGYLKDRNIAYNTDELAEAIRRRKGTDTH